MPKINANSKRFVIEYFEGVNSLVGSNIAKKYEVSQIENLRSVDIGTLETRGGLSIVGNDLSTATSYGIIYFPNDGSNQDLYRIAKVSTTATIYTLNNSDVWTALTGSGAGITVGNFDSTIAEGKLFLVNYNDVNRYIASNGTTVTTSTSAAGDLYRSPKASKIAYYKGQLYLADYLVGSTRFKTTVLRSSQPLGIVAILNGDPASPWTSADVTSTKYIYTASGGNTYDVYRGGTKIAVLTVSAITGDSITMSTVFESGQTELLSADELWVSGTYSGAKVFRWTAEGSESGLPTQAFDTFRLAGGDGSSITMLEPIGNVLMIANNNNMGYWNGYVLQMFDSSIGCVSSTGYVKNLGDLYFVHYGGIYKTNGQKPILISNKVEKYITGATKAGLTGAAAGKKGRSVFFAIGNVTLYHDDGSTNKTLTAVVLEYNITQDNWFVHTGISASQFTSWVESTDADKCVFLSSSSSSKEVFEFLTGTNDSDSEIISRLDTQEFFPSGFFERYFAPQEIRIKLSRGMGVKVYVSLDGSDFYPIEGDARKGASIMKITGKSGSRSEPVRCRSLKISLRHALNQRVKIESLAFSYIPLQDETQYGPVG